MYYHFYFSNRSRKENVLLGFKPKQVKWLYKMLKILPFTEIYNLKPIREENSQKKTLYR